MVSLDVEEMKLLFLYPTMQVIVQIIVTALFIFLYISLMASGVPSDVLAPSKHRSIAIITL
jgi:hypothetical protein